MAKKMMAADIPQVILDTAQAHGVDRRLALEVAVQESGLDQGAVSRAGAIGIFQLMPDTAAQLGVNPYDAEENIEGGIRYLSQLLAQFGDTRAALAAYDWGPGRVRAAMDRYGDAWLDHAPAETRDYVGRVLGNVRTQYGVSFSWPGADAARDGAGLLQTDDLFRRIAIIAGLSILGIFIMNAAFSD